MSVQIIAELLAVGGSPLPFPPESIPSEAILWRTPIPASAQGSQTVIVDWSMITNIPTKFPPITHSHGKGDLPTTIAYEDEGNIFTAVNRFNDNILLIATKKLYLDGEAAGPDMYIGSSADNRIQFGVGGYARFQLSTLAADFYGEVSILAEQRIYLDADADGGHDTYFTEATPNVISAVVGGSARSTLSTTEASFLVDINTSGIIKVDDTQIVGNQGVAVADASGGSVQDAEARTAINTLLARIRAHGLIAT